MVHVRGCRSEFMQRATSTWLVSLVGLVVAAVLPIVVAAATVEAHASLSEAGGLDVRDAYRNGKVFWFLYAAWWLCSIHLAEPRNFQVFRQMPVALALLFCVTIEAVACWDMAVASADPRPIGEPLATAVYVMGAIVVVAAAPGLIWYVRRRVLRRSGP